MNSGRETTKSIPVPNSSSKDVCDYDYNEMYIGSPESEPSPLHTLLGQNQPSVSDWPVARFWSKPNEIERKSEVYEGVQFKKSSP